MAPDYRNIQVHSFDEFYRHFGTEGHNKNAWISYRMARYYYLNTEFSNLSRHFRIKFRSLVEIEKIVVKNDCNIKDIIKNEE